MLTINSVCKFHVGLSSTCSVKVLRLMNGCLSLLESQTVGPALRVHGRMMGHLTMELPRVPVPQIPQGLQCLISPESCKVLGLETVWCGGREKPYCRTYPISLLGFAAPPEVLGTEHSVASPGTGLCPTVLGDIVLCLSVILMVIHYSSAGILPHF